MMFNKSKAYTKKFNRIKNAKLLESVRKKSCLICNTGTMSDPHHLKSVGSGGHDIETNVIPLCRKHHTEIHSLGLNRFSEKYAKLSIWLKRNGWSFNELNNKWSEDNRGGVIL